MPRRRCGARRSGICGRFGGRPGGFRDHRSASAWSFQGHAEAAPRQEIPPTKAATMATIEDVRRIALSLPETSEGPLYGTPGFRVKAKVFARLRDEGATLVAWVPAVDEKEALIATQPEVFFTLPHYDGHPSVLVRLAVI